VITQDHLAIVQPFMKLGSLEKFLTTIIPLSTSPPPSSTRIPSPSSPTPSEPAYTWHHFLKFSSDISSAMNYLHTFTLNNLQKPILHRKLTGKCCMLNSLDVHAETNIYITDFGMFNQEQKGTFRHQHLLHLEDDVPEIFSQG
jgi:hypothetical protein